MDYVHLVGAEEVSRAASQMAQAASTMEQASARIEFSVNAFTQALQAHEQTMRDFMNFMDRNKEN